MSCNTCQSKFSFFTKEHACPNCGFSYCNKCLKYKCNIPNKGTAKVCGPCFNKHRSPDQASPESPVSNSSIAEPLNEMAPIDITKKLDSLENPVKPPIIMYKQTNHWDKLKKGLEPADHEIVDRLRKLKEGDKQVSAPSVEEIKRRLALLKDQDPETATKTVNVHQVDTRTDPEKTDDLIKEYLERLELSSRNDPAGEIQAKLNSLRGEHKDHSCNWRAQNSDDEDDEDKVTKKLIKQALAEAALETKYENVDSSENMEEEQATHGSDDEDEKPSCVTCDQTADLKKCLGCNEDLYCTVCFEENHDEFEMGKHKTVPFDPTRMLSPD